MRKRIVAGNWKMNGTLEEAQKLTSEVVNMVKDEVLEDISVIIAPPFPFLIPVNSIINGNPKIAISSQNCHQEEKGAYTGEVSVPMLSSLDCKYVIIGHSERREYFSETNEQLANKINTSLQYDITPIFCCGETLSIRKNEKQEEFVFNQLTESLFHLTDEEFSKIIIAYEPIWAIGTGVTANSSQAQEMHKAIRKHIEKKYGEIIAATIPILYGGSCKPGNAKELFACEDVDGGLIGGASLKSRDFVDIIKSF